jgi:hypothetical protein
MSAPTLAKLRRKLREHRKKNRTVPKYNEGSDSEKVWINFQATKKFKREFTLYCKENRINASRLLRSLVEEYLQSKVELENDLTLLSEEDA